MQPPPFPRSESDLDEWLVYTDWLLTHGDRRAELMALELALPAAPEPAALRRFHEAARRFCRQGSATAVAWCLGHARSLELPGQRRVMMRSRLAPPPSGALANARVFLQTPLAASLELLSTVYVPDEPKPWRRLFAALPARCVRVALAVWHEMPEPAFAELLDTLPPTVRELELIGQWGTAALGAAIADRFDLVDLGANRVTASILDDHLGARLARTRSVRLQLRHLDVALPWERCLFGAPGDAALLQPQRRRIAMLSRSRLLHRQERFGVIPVRAQLAATVPERYGCAPHQGAIWVTPHGSTLVRRGDTWTLQSSAELPVTRNGESIEPQQLAPLEHGDRVTLGGVECVFITHDIAAHARALFGG